MDPIRYHRQLSRSIYIWGIFTPRDFACLIVALAINLLTIGSNLAMAALIVGYPTYLAAFRLGRPPGHDRHLLQSFVAPKYFRPGREERSTPYAP